MQLTPGAVTLVKEETCSVIITVFTYIQCCAHKASIRNGTVNYGA
jgi:hypothetical protein